MTIRLPKNSLFLLILLFAFLAACGPDRIKETPNFLTGTWVTDIPAYKDRYFRLTTETIAFGTGDFFTPPDYPIKAIYLKKNTDKPQTPYYEIEYKDESGEPLSVKIFASAEKNDTIKIGSIPWDWHKPE